MSSPATGAGGAALLLTDTSAWAGGGAISAVCWFALAEAAMLGTPDAEAVAVLVTIATLLGTTVMVIGTTAPFAIGPRLQVTVVVPLHVPCGVDTLWNVTSAGNGSETVKPVDGPVPDAATDPSYAPMSQDGPTGRASPR